IIFVGVNWARFPGPAKFAVTFLMTGLMYLGGYLLFQRPTLKLGGNALLGIASGFFALNFAVLQIYVVGDYLEPEVMWLIASPICLLLYLFTAHWTKSEMFTYLSISAVGSTVTAWLVLGNAPTLAYGLAYTILMLILLWLAFLVRNTKIEEFTYAPIYWVSQIGMAILSISAITGWAGSTRCTTCSTGSPWIPIISMLAGVTFYTSSNLVAKKVIFRWAAVILLTLAISFTMFEMELSNTAFCVILMVLSLVYLLVGYFIEQKEEHKSGSLPFYITAYAVAFLVTIMASFDLEDLVKILIGDVVLLAVSAYVHKEYRWVSAAAWLFILPVYLFISMRTPDLHRQGLLMSVLGINYIVIGFVLGQRELRLGTPFLTSAAFLSVTTVIMTWGNPLTSSIVLAIVAVLYLLAALWRNWATLLYPSLVAVNLMVLQLNFLVSANFPSDSALIISYTLLGMVCLLGGLGLQQAGALRWAAPLFAAGVLDLLGSYPASLFESGVLAASISAVVGVLLLVFAWLEHPTFTEKKIPPFLPYLGLVVLFGGHFYLMDVVGGLAVWDIWPGFTASLCALYAALSWSLRGKEIGKVYELPLRISGLGLMVIPAVGAVANVLFFQINPILGVITFLIAGMVYIAEAAIRRMVLISYLGISALFISHFYLLDLFDLLDTNYSGILVWPVFTAGICALLVALSWLLRNKKAAAIFETPLRYAGLSFMLIPLVGSALISDPILSAVTFAIAGFVFTADGTIRKNLGLVYSGVLSFVAVIWAMLSAFNITEPQAYVIPIGLAFLGAGWHERQRVAGRFYRIFTLLGLIILMGSAFLQSFYDQAWGYVLLLGAESILSVAWGIYQKLRGFVQLGTLALIANAVVQLGPVFLELDNWIKIGITGSILLGGGMLALFKREQLLETRHKISDEWKSWDS
ncbi:MAG: hypothetical protein ABFS17_14230, partial [Chloroflexota bacterium]